MSGRRTPTGPGAVPPEINLAVLGALGVGKSALTVKYITKRFINEYDPELENTYSKVDVVDRREVLLNIMDTCDQPSGPAHSTEPFSTRDYKNPERYLKWADGLVVVYSVTSRSSFERAERYLDLVRGSRPGDAPLTLVGNKVDLERYRQVSQREGMGAADKYRAGFAETTAAEQYDEVASVFRETALRVLRREAEGWPRPAESSPSESGRTRWQKSPSGRRAEETGRNAKTKLFNKGFRIFQS